LREAIAKVREKDPFEINAFVLRLIKTYVTKHYGEQLGINAQVSLSRQKRKEKNRNRPIAYRKIKGLGFCRGVC
jgi:putative transposase